MPDQIKRNHFLFVLASFITHLGSGASFIIIGKYSYDKFQIASIFGGILLFEFLFSVLLSGKAGRFVDNHDTKKVAYFSDYLLFFFGAIFSIFAFFGHSEVTIIGFSITLYLIKPFQNSSLFALTKKLSDDKTLFKLNSHLGVSYQFGYLIGILVAGLVVDSFSPGHVFLLDSITFLLSGVLIYFCKPISTQVSTPDYSLLDQSILGGLKSDLLQFIDLLRGHKKIVILSSIIALQINLIIAYNTSLFKLVGERSTHSFDLSLFESSYTIASIVLSLLAGQFAYFRLNLKSLWIVFGLQGLIFWSFGVRSIYEYLFLSAAFFGFFSALIFPTSITKLHEVTPNNLLGQAGASKNIINSFFAIPVVSMNAIILDTIGIGHSYQFLSLISLVAATLLLIFWTEEMQ